MNYWLEKAAKKAAEKPERSIIVNGRRWWTTLSHVSYDNIVGVANLATGILYTITCCYDCDSHALRKGESVEIKDGMIFIAVFTGSA